MRRYWAVRRQICKLVKDAVELGPFAVNPKESDVLCEAVARKIKGCGDAIAVLNEIFAARGIHLVEGPDGQWGWNGIRVRSDIVGTPPIGPIESLKGRRYARCSHQI